MGGCWCGTRPIPAQPGELGRHDGPVRAMAVLPGGRVVTGGDDGRVLCRPGHPAAGSAELDRHDDMVQTVAVLANGLVMTGGGDRRALVSDPLEQARTAIS